MKLLKGHLMVGILLGGCAAYVAPGAPRAVPGPSITLADVEYFADHPLMVPVEGVEPSRVPDTFNAARAGGRIHAATDILSPRGTPVLAAIQGVVLRIRQNPAGGIVAYLVDDDRRYVFYYAHLDHYSDQLTEGLRVQQGFVIGYVGTSGNAPPDTPHLHFQAMRVREGQKDWWNGVPVDVRPFMKEKGRKAEPRKSQVRGARSVVARFEYENLESSKDDANGLVTRHPELRGQKISRLATCNYAPLASRTCGFLGCSSAVARRRTACNHIRRMIALPG